MPIQLVVVDSFTTEIFHGNPAAVAVLDAFPSDATMQNIAFEMNLSETAFVVKRDDGDYDLRWFTPSVEIELCGHATLASAHVLGVDARFHTLSGVLTCSVAEDGWITMDFPADAPSEDEKPEWFELENMVWFGRCRIGVLIELEDGDLVRNFVPDLAALKKLSDHTVIVTARSLDGQADFVSRVFGPSLGIDEDPVTGSAHCVLAEFWGERLQRQELTGEQVSKRGGIVKMRRSGERIELLGQAVTVSNVTLLIA